MRMHVCSNLPTAAAVLPTQGLGFGHGASGAGGSSWQHQDQGSMAASFKSMFVAAGTAPSASTAGKRPLSPDRC